MLNYALDWGLDDRPLVELAYLYGAQTLFVATLIAITIFRREISCNHCYAEGDEDNRGVASTTSASQSTSRIIGDNNIHDDISQRAVGWDDEEREFLLEAAGFYCSGVYKLLTRMMNILQRILPKSTVRSIWNTIASWWIAAAEGQGRLEEILDHAENWYVSPPIYPPADIIVPATKNIADENTSIFPSAEEFPTDAAVHILSFLHPKDVLSFASASGTTREFVENEEQSSSSALWKTLWYRDYSWIVQAWNIGQKAIERSFSNEPSIASLADIRFSKEFYFRFGLCYIDYLLAGQCSFDCCLVGISGNIYDMTDFLEKHPGSPETVIIHAGRDATAAFQGMRHTVSARKRAQQLCITVDRTTFGGVGVSPTTRFALHDSTENYDKTTTLPPPVEPVAPDGLSSAVCPVATVAVIRHEYENEKYQIRQYTVRRLRVTNALDEIHEYYDPICNKWKAWYLNQNFEPVFIHDI